MGHCFSQTEARSASGTCPGLAKTPVEVTDASNNGIHLVLCSARSGMGRKKRLPTSVTPNKVGEEVVCMRKELLALVAAVSHFHYYLYWRHIKIRTDHGALKWLINFKNPEGQTARWIKILEMYDLEVDHRQGCSHGSADGLSRRPCGDCRHCERNEKKVGCKDNQGCEERGDKQNEVDGEEHHCVAAKRSEDGCTQESHNEQTNISSWLPVLSNAELRRDQLPDSCLGSVNSFKQKHPECPPWEEVAYRPTRTNQEQQ